MLTFSAHGSFIISPQLDTVFSVLEGPFNEQGVSNYIEHLMHLLNNQSFIFNTKIIQLVGLGFFTPEAEALFASRKLELFSTGLSKVIIVLEEALYPNAVMAQWQRLFIDTPFQLQFIDKLNDVIKELKKENDQKSNKLISKMKDIKKRIK